MYFTPPMELYNDPELLEGISKGDQHSFGELVTRQWPQVYGTALRLTRSPEEAKDLAQDMFLKLWENRHKLPGVKNINTFIYVAARNLVMDHLEKKVLTTVNIEYLVDYFQESNVADGQRRLEFKELENAISGAIQALPEKVREVFVLHRFEGLNHAEIAKKLGISEVSSKTYIVRALKDIRQYLSRHSDSTYLLLLAFFRLLK